MTAPCGTYGAYVRHIRNGDPIDDACAEARREYQTAYRSRRTPRSERQKHRQRAEYRAARKLINENWPRYCDLLDKEMESA